MSKRYSEVNVYDAANERLAVAFRDFEYVLIAFSAGKDSGVMLNLAYDYAKANNLLHKLAIYYEDYEAGYKFTHEYAERVFSGLPGVTMKYWLCLPISAACAVSMHQTRWMPWDEDLSWIAWCMPVTARTRSSRARRDLTRASSLRSGSQRPTEPRLC